MNTPVKVLAPVNVWFPRPFLVTAPVPEITPPNEPVPLSAPTVRLPEPIVIFPPNAPPPEIDPRVLLYPFRSNLTPARFDRVTALFKPKALVEPARMTPCSILTPSVKVFVPANTSNPSPCLVNPVLVMPVLAETVTRLPLIRRSTPLVAPLWMFKIVPPV